MKQLHKCWLTQPPSVRTGPWPSLVVCETKYWDIETPRNKDTPKTYRFRMELVFANWINEIPEAAGRKGQEKQHKPNQTIKKILYIQQD